MIPTAALRQRVTLRRYLGEGGTGGPVFADPLADVPARLVGKRRAVRTREGTDVIADATCDLRPVHKGQTLDVLAESEVVDGDRTYTVLGVADLMDLTRPHGIQLLLAGPR